MDRKDRKTKTVRKKKYSKKDMKQYVTKNQLDVILDRRIEDKFINNKLEEIPLVDFNSAAGNEIQELSVSPEGTGPQDFVGLRVKPKSIYGRFHLTGNQNIPNAGLSTLVRIMVIQWHLDAVAPPDIDDILDIDGPPTLLANGIPLAYNNLGNVNKFSVIYNKIVELSNDDDNTKFIQVDEFYHEFSKRQRMSLYNNLGGATTGHFYLVWFSDKSLANAPNATYVMRFRYEDA